MTNHESSLARPCYHGGAFFDAIGSEFDHLERRHDVINADVLDAWFPPSSRVVAALQAELPWLLRTSPPTRCEGLARAIARARGVRPENILPGGGSSDLIFLALREWLNQKAHVLILDPMYGEYAHVLENVIGCQVDRLSLARETSYRVDLEVLAQKLKLRYDLVILVNPNSPTGQHIPRADLVAVLKETPRATRIWLDETYVEFAGAEQSLERVAAMSQNLVVCKSMSKVYALSGARVAYLCGPDSILAGLRHISPPWAVSLPGQVAGCAALQDLGYYSSRHQETHELRGEFLQGLQRTTGWQVLPGIANFLLCHLPDSGPTAAEVVRACRAQNLFLRDADAMGRCFQGRAIRIAIKDAATNARMLKILAKTLTTYIGSAKEIRIPVHIQPCPQALTTEAHL